MPLHPATQIFTAQELKVLQQEVLPQLPQLQSCRSLAETEKHPVFLALNEKIQRVLEGMEIGDLRRQEAPAKGQYRVVAWNIERGVQLDAQLDALQRNPYLRDFDLLLLSEVDKGMARSGNRDVAREIAERLELAYAYVPCYLNLGKGSGRERDTEGENQLGLQGNALFSRHPISDIRRLPLTNGIDKMSSREKRLGCLSAVAADVHFPDLVATAVTVHLDAQSTQAHRRVQMREVLAATDGGKPCILGGDWNTSTYDSSTVFRAIVGYWVRLFMGVEHVIRNHCMHPYRRFEKPLFGLLESEGFDYRECNVLGERTAYYDMLDAKAHRILAEWIPGWCFPFIRWALRNHGGVCPLKLDWFAARGLRCLDPRVIHDLKNPGGTDLSDHDPIGVDILPVYHEKYEKHEK